MNLKFPNFIYIIIVLCHFILCLNSTSTYFSEIEKCKITSHGKEYVGTINETQTAKKCLKWSKEILKNLNLQDLQYSDNGLDLNNNYCRNPTNQPNGPWCIVNYETLKWDYCNIPSCDKSSNWCKDTEMGEDYIGQINYSKSGKPCQPWTNQTKYPDYMFPDNNLNDAGNNCRNPDHYSSGPWCYTVNETVEFEECDVPICDKTFSQIEYFGGYDFLKTIEKQISIFQMKNIHRNVTFVVSVDSGVWTQHNQERTSLWATSYDTTCQRDLNEYEFCQLSSSTKKNNQVTLVYHCLQPFINIIFVTTLQKSQYRTEYRLGELNEIKENPSQGLLAYQQKITTYLNQRNRKNLTIKSSTYHGFFFLLNDNTVPYAITSDSKVVLAFSNVGKGRIGFVACEHYLSEDFRSHLEDFYHTVYDKADATPVALTPDLLMILDLQRKSEETISTHVKWNAHQVIGESAIILLLDLVNAGLKVIIGIKPWSYNLYKHNLQSSELKEIFVAAGIWPSLSYRSDKLTVLNNIVVETFPLVHLLDYARTSLSDALRVADAINTALLETPFEELITGTEFSAISENIKSLFHLHLYHAKSLIPCINKPTTTTKDKSIINLINTLVIQPLGNKLIAPGVSFYPGNVNVNKAETVQMKLNLKFNNEATQLGLYVPPGKDVSVKISGSKSEKCDIYLNYHHFNALNQEWWYKWPITYKSFSIYRDKLKVFSFGFGGLISILCIENDDKVDIILSGVVPVPMYDRRDPEINKNWNKLQQRTSPWAILAGDTVVFVVSSNAIRNLADPESVLEMYDSMLKEEIHMRGKLVADHRRELISTDIQIKAGYMHAGYPIGTQIYYVTNPAETHKYLFGKLDIKTEGRWGILHEVGHNLQEWIFTFSGTTDVTNNVFTLLAVESMTGNSSWSQTEGWISDRSYIDRFISYIDKGKFTEWQNEPFLALGVYAQIQANFGWELYSQIFRRYDVLIKSVGKLSDNEKIQLWIKETSIHTSMNLCPVYDLWRWPIDERTNKDLQKYPYFMPDDFLIKLVQKNVDEIIKKYGGLSVFTRKPKEIPTIVGPLKNKFSIEGSQIIEEMIILN